MAGRIGFPYLRSLDAIHLATCALLAEEVECLVTYDKRQAQYAETLGFEVAQPA